MTSLDVHALCPQFTCQHLPPSNRSGRASSARRTATLIALTLTILCGLTQRSQPVQAQSLNVRNSGTFLPSNRVDSRGIARAQELIADGQYSQAIRFLDDILARPQDSFVVVRVDGRFGSDATDNKSSTRRRAVRDDDGNISIQSVEVGGGSTKLIGREIHLGLKETARLMIRDLPPEGRRIYETTFGPVAQRLLKQATATGDVEQLRQITQRYFYTPAGYEAALLFAQHESDHGRHLTAALTYQQLLDTPEAAARFQPQLAVLAATSWIAANQRDQANGALEIFDESNYRSIRLSDQDYPVRSSRHGKIDWLLQSVGTPVIEDLGAEQQWLTLRGNSARSGSAEGGLPHLRVRWQVRLLEHHGLETVHDKMAGLLKRQNKARVPAAVPLAVGDYIITRSAHGLVAIDFRTGKRIWRSQPERVSALRTLTDSVGAQNENENQIEPAHSFARLVWEDYLYNTTSSDGKRVFVIRDLTPPSPDRVRNIPIFQQQLANQQAQTTNRLCAYDLPTQGKLVWEIDGAARQDKLQGAFFLGAPVAVGQSLYCLAEIKSDTAIYLIALDRETGALQWRQQLADLERGITRDVKRRLQASMPSYDGGILVCATGAGVVVGVDLAKQALAWAYSYPTQALPNPRQRIIQPQVSAAKQHWVHSAPVIVDGRILLTPPESDQLHCLDLRSGKLLWKRPQKDSLFLAGVDGQTVLLVGNSKLTALNLADGSPAWNDETLELPAGSTPTGSGFFSDGKYFLPLSTTQVVAVDVEKGVIVDEASSSDGHLLGNLICYRGAVISQTGRHLDCFEQVNVLRTKSEQRLANDPTDFEALRTLGEIALNDGRLDQSIELLRQAYEHEPEDLRTREVLSEALIAGLDEDFAEFQHHLPLLTEIQPTSAEAQVTVLRLQAQGLQELGRATESFEICLLAYDKLVALDLDLQIESNYRVDAQRWLTAQVASAWTSASQQQRGEMLEQLRPLLTEVSNVDDPMAWQQFHACFREIEATELLAIDLAADHLDFGRPLAAQRLLMPLLDSSEPTVRAAAVALNSKLLHAANLPQLSRSFDLQLNDEYANIACLDEMTGQQCLDTWTDPLQIARVEWPYGAVEVDDTQAMPNRRTTSTQSPRSGVYLEHSDEVLGRCNVTLVGMASGRNRAISVSDSLGREFFQASLDQSSRSIVSSQGSVFGASKGNLLVLSLGRQIVAFDTLSPGSEPLWRIETTSNLQYFHPRSTGRLENFGRRRASRAQINGNWLGIIGPVTHDSCIFQIEQRLVCVDPMTGEVKWSRDELPLGCDLFGDEQHVVVVPKDADQGLVFSTIDGRSLGETAARIPAWRERLTTHGRHIVRWRKRADRRLELSSIDTLEGKTLWKYEFERNSQPDLAEDRFVAVVEPSGRCVIIDIRDGSRVVDQQIQANLSLQHVHLQSGSERFIVAVQKAPEVNLKRSVNGFNTIDFTRQPFAGHIYSFDRQTGKPEWNRPATVQGLPLLLAQPVDLPMLTFAGNIRRRDSHGAKNEIGLMLLEKSSGRVLYHQENLPPSTHHFYLRASKSDPNVAEVEMLTRQIALKFTDRPRAPEPPAMHDARRNVDTGAKGLQKIGERFLQGL